MEHRELPKEKSHRNRLGIGLHVFEYFSHELKKIRHSAQLKSTAKSKVIKKKTFSTTSD